MSDYAMKPACLLKMQASGLIFLFRYDLSPPPKKKDTQRSAMSVFCKQFGMIDVNFIYL